MERPRTSVIIRWIIAVLVAGAAAWLLLQGMGREPNTGGVVGKSLGGFALLLTAGLLIASEVIGWAIAPINYLLDSILMPSETIHPPVDYKLARFYYEQMRYEEACDEYFKILSYHPHEILAYVEGMASATAVGQHETAEKFYRMALRKLSARNGEREQFLHVLANGPEPEAAASTGEEAEESLLPGPEAGNLHGDEAAPDEVHRDGREQQRDNL